uniref:Uncharacterized protein n=1 Tax=Lepeophtheirus salmonis TaxID=72036 RepID=A0A0K2TWP8_LEPSM
MAPFLTRFEPTGLFCMEYFVDGNQQDLRPKCGVTKVLHSSCMRQLVQGVCHQLLHGFQATCKGCY